MGKGTVDLGMRFICFFGGEGDAEIWDGINILEGIECRFEMLQTGVVVVC